MSEIAEGVVLARTGGRYRVLVDEDVVEATLRGRLRQSRERRVLVGDRVTMRRHADGDVTLEEILSRTSTLRRRTPGRGRGTRAVAANITQVVTVGAASEPNWNTYLMDRFIAVAEANGIPVVIVINKCDLVGAVESLAEPYRGAGYPVLLTSVRDRRGLDELRNTLEDRVSVITGPTGVGKSSLLNALQPGLQLRTAPVSSKSRAGKHTTVQSEMHRFGRSGFVVDTPGLRDIGLWGLESQDVEAAFPEIQRAAGDCRFDNCRHLEEPGCAVVKAVEKGQIAGTRLQSYRQLLQESLDALRTWT